MKILSAVVLLVSLVFSCVSIAEVPSRDQLISLYASAYGRLGIGIPENNPHIYPVSQATLWAIADCEHCNIQGAQLGDSVFYLETLDFIKPMDSSILLHELIHYVQWWRYGTAKTCEERADREWQAYKIQAFVLEQNNIYFPIPQRMSCDGQPHRKAPIF